MVFIGVRVQHGLAFFAFDINVSIVAVSDRGDIVAVAAVGEAAAVGTVGPVVHGPLVGGAHDGLCAVSVGWV